MPLATPSTTSTTPFLRRSGVDARMNKRIKQLAAGQSKPSERCGHLRNYCFATEPSTGHSVWSWEACKQFMRKDILICKEMIDDLLCCWEHFQRELETRIFCPSLMDATLWRRLSIYLEPDSTILEYFSKFSDILKEYAHNGNYSVYSQLMTNKFSIHLFAKLRTLA